MASSNSAASTGVRTLPAPAWHALLDSEWPQLKAAYEAWLAPENFDAAGRQLTQLGDGMRAIPEER